MKQRLAYSAGFTLLEILLALAIFATAGVAIMQASGGHIRAISQLEEQTIAAIIANNQLQQALISKQWPPRELEQGEVSMANRDWLWQLKASTVPDADLRQLQLEVRLAEQPDVLVYQLVTFVGRPSG
ncbi:type II secretion system minor pseudopilin GspI [Arsukibacterium sp.]|uniref:type II secretion system minor pseudopilin GspI n=1 Tax=Arsukibacterium sp. TaxID=1977258 RepID=UPI002FD99780